MISSKDNPHFKNLLKLGKKRHREGSQTFIVEGEREVARAKGIETLYFTERTPFVESLEKKGIEAFQISPKLFSRVSYRDRGVLAIAKMCLSPLEELSQSKFLLVAEAIEKPGNLGAMLRTCDAVGIDGVIIADPVVDLFNPNVVRASLGALFTCKIAQGSSEVVYQQLKAWGVRPLVTSLQATQSLYQADLTGSIAVVVGSEAKGVSPLWEKECISVKIPMVGEIDSLNASIATGVVLYEVFRQRHSPS